MIMCYKLL